MVPQTSALRQPLNVESDAIGETVNDRSLSNEAPPSYYDVQTQEQVYIPSYTEVIQENQLQESINAAGSIEVTVTQEQLQETATTRIQIPQSPCKCRCRDVT